MTRFSNEFLVGLLAIVVVGLAAWAMIRTDDRPDGLAGTWTAYVSFPSAEGVYPDTPVRIAGVTIGGVDAVVLDGGQARLTLMLQSNVKLSVDSFAEIGSEGMLGDKFIRVTPGNDPSYLLDGATMKATPPGADIEGLTKKMGLIADDVAAITGTMRDMTEDPVARAQLSETMENVKLLSIELRDMAAANRGDLDAMAQNLRATSEALRAIVERSGGRVDDELATVKEATESMERAVKNLEEITRKVNDGEGTMGKLINDPATVDSLNDTLNEVNATVKEVSSLVNGITGLQTDLYYRGNYFFGSDPTRGDLALNPVAGGTRNTLGIKVAFKPDYFYLVELVSAPQGLITYEDHALPELGTAYREYTVTPSYRVSFQFAKRWGPAVFRFGMKESSGGVGVDAYLFKNRLMFSADVFDFLYGSYPIMDGTPNVELAARAYPWRNVYLEGGANNLLLGAKYGFFTGFVGGGFTFNDQDLRLLLPMLPL